MSKRKNTNRPKIAPNLKTFSEWLKYLENDLFKKEVYRQILKAC